MAYRALFVAGSLLLAAALAFGATLLWHTQQARSLGNSMYGFSGSACQHPIDHVSPQQLVMSQSDTKSVRVALVNKGSSTCKLTVKLDAPHFEPSSRAETVSLAAGETTSVIWLLKPPEKTGDFQIKLGAALDQATVGIRVTTVLGLSAAQAELLTLLGTILGGTGVTIPWLHSIYSKRRGKRTSAPRKA